MKGLIIAIVAVAIIGLGYFAWTVGVKNDIIAKENLVDEKWAEIDNMLMSRNEKIPKLIAVTNRALSHEAELFKELTEARAKMVGGTLSRGEKMDVANQMSSALSRLLVINESNPQLKADKTITGLMDEVAGMENRLTFARTTYNKAVTAYNTTIRQWPGSSFGFEKKELFNVPENKKADVDVDALLNK